MNYFYGFGVAQILDHRKEIYLCFIDLITKLVQVDVYVNTGMTEDGMGISKKMSGNGEFLSIEILYT